MSRNYTQNLLLSLLLLLEKPGYGSWCHCAIDTNKGRHEQKWRPF